MLALLVVLACAAVIGMLVALRGRAEKRDPERELLVLCQGDGAHVERLIAFERGRSPGLGRRSLARRAVLRWMHDRGR